MGNYNQAVITTQGLELITRAIAGEVTLTFSHMAISDHAYPAGTNLAALTSLQDVKMTVEPASVWVRGNIAGVRGLFANTNVTVAYLIQTVGVYATDGTTEILFSVSTAADPDEMPAYNGVASTSFIFTVQETISEASTINITVTEAGVATAQDIADLQASKQDKITGAASTVVSSNLTANRVVTTNASGKINVSIVTKTELEKLSGVTSPIQTQIDGKQATIGGAASTITDSDLAASKALVSSASGKVAASNVTAAELAFLSGVTSNVQAQITALKRTVVTQLNTDLNDYMTTGTYLFGVDYAPVNRPIGTNGILIVISANGSDTATTQCKQFWLRLGTPSTTSFQAFERLYLNGTWGDWARYLTDKDTLLTGAASTIETADLTASRALISNASGKVGVSATTSTELGFLSGTTGNVQTQINGLSDSVTSLQTAVNGKQATITGGATSITSNNLTASRALISNSSGKVAVSAVTSTELGRLSGVTSPIQTQLDNHKPSLAHDSAILLEYTNVGNNANANAGNFTIEQGWWIITVTARWNANATGTRQLWLSDTIRGDAIAVGYMSIVTPVNGDSTIHQIAVPVYASEQKRYYVVVKQTSGATIQCSVRYSTLRIATA